MGFNTAKIDHVLGRPGQKMGEVYRVGFPRTDLQVSAQGVPILPGLGLDSWAAFSGSEGEAAVMGDLVLLQDEVTPVMEKLSAAGFEITAIHNHLLGESPRVMYMHFEGRGAAATLAGSLRAVLAASKTPLGKPASAAAESSTPPTWVKTVQDALGRKSEFRGGMLSVSVSRAEVVTMEGMAESINFQSCDRGAAKAWYPGHRAAQPHAHRTAAALFHALLGRRHSRSGSGGAQGGVEPRRNAKIAGTPAPRRIFASIACCNRLCTDRPLSSLRCPADTSIFWV